MFLEFRLRQYLLGRFEFLIELKLNHFHLKYYLNQHLHFHTKQDLNHLVEKKDSF